MTERIVHPEVAEALSNARDLTEKWQTALEDIDQLALGRRSDDGDIQIQVNSRGQLINCFLRPGAFDRRKPHQVAAEINRLLADATAAAADEVQRIFTGSHEPATT